MPETGSERPRLVEDVEALAERASSRGALRRASDLRAVAEHLRAKHARQVVIDVRPEALARRGSGGRVRMRGVLGRVRRVVGRVLSRLRGVRGRPRR